MSPSPRPPSSTPPAPAPLIAPTGSPGLNCVIDVVNATAAPFQQAPPPEQGAAGWVAQGLGGVLGVIGAPAQIIDTGFAALTAPLAKLFPSLPACTLGALHIGPPHAHAHPPSLVVPPPIPLPSIGCVLGAGAFTVFLGGLPAARAGDIGISVTCGSLAPPFEIYTGSSNVFLGGSRAARILDITKHCNPSSMGPFDIAMGAAGVVAGAAGAIATGNSYAAAQAAADAAVLAIKLLCGKDPGIPPGMGLLLGPPVPNVLIGGFPCPPIGEMAVGGLMKLLGKAMRALSKLGNSRRGNGHCAEGSHPIYLPTGENFDSFVDFVSGGLFEWRRHVTSARAKVGGPHGHGWRHFLQRSLSVRLHKAVYTDWDGERFEFPRFRRGRDTVRADGYVLKRIERGRYWLSYRNEPAMEFAGGEFDGELLLVRLVGNERELRLEYDAAGRLCAAEEGPTGSPTERRRWALRLDTAGHIVEITEVGVGGGTGGATVGKPISRAMFAYDAVGNLVKAVDALGGVATYEYDTFHRVTKQTDARGYYYSFKYDVWGRCIRASGMDGLWACRVEYFPEQGFTRYTEGEDATWEYHYEKDGFVTKIVDPYGGEKRRERDTNGRTACETDSGGRRLRWLYDADGAHRARIDDYGNVFPPELELAWLPDPFERWLPATAMERQLGGLVKELPAAAVLGGSPLLLGAVPVELAAWAHRNFRLRPPNAPLTVPETRRERDALGRLMREIDPWGRSREWRYDATGNVVAEQDRDGRVTRYHTTSWNLVGGVTDPLGHEMRYRYSSLEQVTEVLDPLGNVTRYDYDLKGRLVRIYRNDRIKEEYVYDDGDHFIEKLDGDGKVLFTNEPHANHRVAKRVLASGGFHSFDYDHRGRVTQASTEAHEVRLEYDASGRCVADVREGRGVRCHHEYNDGHVKWHRHVLDRFVTIEELYAPGNVTVTSPTGDQTTLRWDASGMMVRVTVGGTIEVSQYDHEGRLENQIVGRAANGAWQALSLSYRYTAEGDLTHIADSSRGTTRYEVDAAHRLVGETTPDGRCLAYGLDAAGNVVAKPGLRRAEFAAGNRISESEDEVFSFDERNHIALRRRRDGFTTRYVYDSFDMLVRVERMAVDGSPLPGISYEYDALGRRCTVRGASNRDFFWEEDRLAAEILPDGKLRVYDYAGRDALVPIGFTEYANIDGDPSTGYSCQVFSNLVGMPLLVEDANGQIVWWSTRVDPYGTIDVHGDSSIEYNLRWPGHYFDPETGLHYNRHRYYDPRLGRYLQSDPLGYDGSEVNLYGYAPNPLGQVDLLGLAHGKRPKSKSKEQNQAKEPELTQSNASNIPSKMLGANGPQISSKTIWKGENGMRIDIENPNPGQRPGQIHFQQGNAKHLYDPSSNSFPTAPRSVNDLLSTKSVQDAVAKGLRFLGEA